MYLVQRESEERCLAFNYFLYWKALSFLIVLFVFILLVNHTGRAEGVQRRGRRRIVLMADQPDAAFRSAIKIDPRSPVRLWNSFW